MGAGSSRSVEMISWMADSMWSIRSDIWFTVREKASHEGQRAIENPLRRILGMLHTSVTV